MSQPRYRIRVVAERVGISEALLRAWERRYHLLQPQRTAGGYRAYTEDDVALLLRVKDLLARGMAIGEAAQLAAQAPGAAVGEMASSSATSMERWRASLLEGAKTVDQALVESVLDEALAALPASLVFERLLAPTLVEAGDRWHRGELDVAQEHLLSLTVRNRMVAVLASGPRAGARHVVCACLPEETHEIGLLGAALRFREFGYRVTWLGARVPPEALAHAVRVLRPTLVALSAIVDEGPRGFRATLSTLVRALPRGVPVVVGGAAARQHASTVQALGAELVDAEVHWERLLRDGVA